MERRDENLEQDGRSAERDVREETYTDREQRLADEDRLSRDLERERDDLERSLDISVTPEPEAASVSGAPHLHDEVGDIDPEGAVHAAPPAGAALRVRNLGHLPQLFGRHLALALDQLPHRTLHLRYW